MQVPDVSRYLCNHVDRASAFAPEHGMPSNKEDTTWDKKSLCIDFFCTARNMKVARAGAADPAHMAVCFFLVPK